MADTAGTPKDTIASAAGDKAPDRSSRKRKADELSDETPHLPAPVWGHVLDFMPYSEVRSALLVGKHIAVEAAKYVQALNIMRGCELYIPAARRFGNVEEVNILCFLELTREEDDNGWGAFSVSLDVSNRTVPFLGSFAKLTRGFLGSLETGADYFLNDQDVDVYRGLLTAYVGAVKSGAFSEKIALEGADLWPLTSSLCRQKSSNCRFCRDILSHFPFRGLLDVLVSQRDMFCQTEQDHWDIVRRRPDADKGFSEVSEEALCTKVSRILHDSYRTIDTQFIELLPEKWRLEARTCELLWVYSVDQSDLQKLDELIEKGFDLKCVTRKFALKEWKHYIGAQRDSRFCTWTRTTVESLAARGFPVDCNCVPAIDIAVV